MINMHLLLNKNETKYNRKFQNHSLQTKKITFSLFGY